MTNKTITLSRELACPFCGSKELKQVTDDGIHFTQCKSCEATGPTGFKRGEDDTIDWNTRVALAEPVPPAGGDVQVAELGLPLAVLREALSSRDSITRLANMDVRAVVNKAFDEFKRVSAHVTRLQAEVRQLRQHKNDYMEAAEETRKALQSELTKARAEAEKWEAVARDFAVRRDELKQELDACNGKRSLPNLSQTDFIVLNGLVAKNYQNARRLCQRASTPVKNAEAQAKLKLAEDLMHALSNQSAPADKGRGELVLQWSDDDGLTWMDGKENEMA